MEYRFVEKNYTVFITKCFNRKNDNMYSYTTTTSGMYPNGTEEALLKASIPRYTFEDYFGIKKREKGLCADGATIKDVIFNNPATIVMWSDGTINISCLLFENADEKIGEQEVKHLSSIMMGER